MAGLFGSLEIGKRGLIHQRMAMDTIGHNIANANTEGYSRQKVRFAATDPRIDRNHLIGTGVGIMQFERMRDNLIDKEVRYMKSNLGYSEQKLQLMSNIEGMFPEPSDYGLQSYFSNFFSELRNVSNNPLDQTIRNTFVQSAVTLTKGFNRTADNMIQMAEDTRISISERVRDINNLLAEIDTINQKVATQHNSGLQANDLRDRRDQKLDELSKYMNIQKEEQQSGAVLVYSNGYHLVGEDTHMSLSHENSFNGQNEVSVVRIKESDQELELKSGELKALLDTRNTKLPEYIERLNTLATTIADEFNEIHRSAFGLSLNGNPPRTNVNLFEGNTAASLSVNQLVSNEPSHLALSSSGDPGDSEAGISLLDLEKSKIVDNTYTLTEFYGFIVGDIGIETNNERVAAQANEISLATFQGERDAISGVSLDEELTDLIRTERSYQAAAKVISTVDTLIESVLALK